MKSRVWLAGLTLVFASFCASGAARGEARRQGHPLWPMTVGDTVGSYESSISRNPEALFRNAFQDIEVRDTLVYCLQGFLCGDSCASLMILNISDPTQPKFVSRLRFHGGAEQGIDLKLYGDYAYLTVTGPDATLIFYAVDISDPTSLQIAGNYPPSAYAYSFDVVDSLAFFTYGSPDYGDTVNAVHIINVSSPDQMSLVGKIPTEFGLYTIFLKGSYAFAPGFGSEHFNLYTLDIANPSEGRIVSNLVTGYCPIRLAGAEDDSLLYVADGDAMWPDYWSALTVLNVADPEHPSILSQFPLVGAVMDVKVKDRWVFVSHGSCGLQVFDASDPVAPDSVARFEVPGFAGRLALQDSLLLLPDVGPFVADAEGLSCYPPVIGPGEPQEGDLLILNIADPTHPDLLGFYAPTAQDPTDVDDTEEESLPSAFAVHQNYPNPFNPGTIIEFDLPVRAEVELSVYNLLGQEVTRLVQSQPAGHHTIQLNMRDQASGVYFYELRAGDYSGSGKMLLLK